MCEKTRDHRTPTLTCITDEPTTYDWRRSAPSECTGVYINPAPRSPGFMSPVFLLPAPSLYSWLLRCNVWRMVARIRAKTWSIGSTGRFSPARHHESLPSILKKDCTRSRSALCLHTAVCPTTIKCSHVHMLINVFGGYAFHAQRIMNYLLPLR
jgi:hypothetical protein